MEARDALISRIAFASYRGINLGTARRLEARGIGPEEFFSKSSASLSALSGLRTDIFDDKRRRTALEQASRESDFVVNNRIRAIFHTDPEFPKRLAECDDAPALLYVLGECDINFRHVVSIVGTRHSTAYGIDFTKRLVHDLATSLDSLLIVSGLAYGIDIAAHRAALAEGIPTGAVLAHGLNTIYPADHRDEARRIVRDNGFLASEYRSCDSIHRGNFLARNRIVAGLSDVTVVVESDRKGGAMSTAAIASAYNREVMAVPGRVYDTYSRGCNDLIAGNRAAMVRDAADLIDAAGWTAKAAQEGAQQELDFTLDEERKNIIDYISGNPEATVNDMCAALGLPYSHLSAVLFEMEMDDLIVSIPGGRYGVICSAR